jgi:hypothetical protein
MAKDHPYDPEKDLRKNINNLQYGNDGTMEKN